MKTRNKLLSEIVVASGGTVTDENNRNVLLQDWLDAAGQVCLPLWQPNGVNQGCDSPLIPIVIGDTVSVKVIATPTAGGGQVIIAGGGNHLYTVADTFYMDGGRFTATLDGQPIVQGVTLFPSDGLSHEIICTAQANFNVEHIGYSGSSFFCSFPIYDFIVGSGLVFNLPLDDGFANNPTARNSGSGGDGIFINNDTAAWGERCE